jgi:AraC-like DNA-binding protein
MAFTTSVLRSFLASVEWLQISRQHLLSGQRVEAIVDSEGWLENTEFYEVIRRALQLSGDPALGLHVGEREQGHFTGFGAAGLLFSVVPTFREAIHAMARFHEVARDVQDLVVGSEGHSIAVVYRPFDATGAVRSCLVEIVFANLAAMLKQFGGVGGVAQRIQLDYPAPAYAAEYRRLFGCDVEFDCARVAMVVARELADRRQLLSHPELAAALRARAEKHERPRTLVESVRRQVRDSWSSGAPTMETVARGLGMSQRSLHRHLARQGVDYRSILNDARLEAAAELLRDRRKSVKEVAHEVGFSNASAFYRAFKRWTGYSPSEYVSGASASADVTRASGADRASAER